MTHLDILREIVSEDELRERRAEGWIDDLRESHFNNMIAMQCGGFGARSPLGRRFSLDCGASCPPDGSSGSSSTGSSSQGGGGAGVHC